MLTITSTRTNTKGDLIEVCAERADMSVSHLKHGYVVGARINGGKWLPVEMIKPQVLGGKTVSGVVAKTVAIYADEISAAQNAYKTLPQTMSQLIEQRRGLVDDAAHAGGQLNHAMSSGDCNKYAASAGADRADVARAAAALAEFDAQNPSVVAQAARAITVNPWN